MNKILFVLLLLIIGIMFFESCSDEFSINAPAEDVYVLNCILRTNSSVQYAIISKNVYTNNGVSPTSNSVDQYIQGANVKIIYNDSAFVMRDTTIQIIELGSETPVNCYYIKDLNIKDKVVKIEATLANGKVLKSTISVPFATIYPARYYFPRDYYSGFSAQQYYTWVWSFRNSMITNVYNLPQLVIYYKKYESGTYIDKKILVPLAYNYDTKNYGIFSNGVYPSYNFSCATTLKTMNKTMQDISGDDPYKNNYIITKVIFNIIGLESHLARYYFANNTFREGFSIKLRQTDVSNIEGGKGIFGAYCSYSKVFVVDSIYVKSFGYRYEP